MFSLFDLFGIFQVTFESRALRSDALAQSRCVGSPLFAIVRLRRAEDGPAAPAYLLLRFTASSFGFHACMSTYRNPVPFRVELRSLDIPLCLLRGVE